MPRPMQTVCEQAKLRQGLDREAVLLMLGGGQCGVCRVLKPQIESMLEQEFPRMAAYYVDCHGDGQALCAQQGIFSLPVVQVWFGGRKFAEFARVFSLADLRSAISRPYTLAFG